MMIHRTRPSDLHPLIALACLPCSLIALPHEADANQAQVVVVEGDFVGKDAQYMRPEAQRHTRTMLQALDAARVRYTTTADSLVEKHGLPRARVAILPYNRAISRAELQRLLDFVKAGGKLIVCLLAPPELLAAVGAQGDEIIIASREGQFATMAFGGASLLGLPPEVRQGADKIRVCAPRRGATALGHWRSADATPSKRPGVILSSAGAFLSSVLPQQGDRTAQGALMRALCGHFAPEVWRQSVPVSPQDIRPLGNYPSLEDMRQRLLHRQRAGEDVSRALGAVREVLTALADARKAFEAGDVQVAVSRASEAEALAQRAYWMSYPSKNGELRGVWACNTVPSGWQSAMATLRDSNLNAVFPYVCSAGVAWYRSSYLPRASDKDYLTRATNAGREHGMPVHARMLGLYTMCAPEGFKQKLREQGRLMISRSGKTTSWLCPVNPDNRRLLARLAVEMVTKYPVAGLQLDYMRYPGEAYCFCPTCRASFRKHIGRDLKNMSAAVKSGPLRDQFLDWRRDQITTLIRDIRAEALRARPDLAISAAVFINWEDHRNAFAQDWKTWVDRGLVEFVCPMNYTADNDRFAGYIQKQVRWVNGQAPLCPGIGLNADGMEFGGPQMLLDQITIARNLKTEGWVIFNYAEDLAEDYLPYLKLGATSSPSSFNPFRHVVAPPLQG